MPPVWEGKKYKLVRNEGFENYLKSVGVNVVLRKFASALSTTVELKKDGDEYQLITTSLFKNITNKFKIEEEYEEETWFDGKVKCIMSQEGDNRFVKRELSEIPTVIIREFTEDELIITTTRNFVICKLFYKASN